MAARGQLRSPAERRRRRHARNGPFPTAFPGSPRRALCSRSSTGRPSAWRAPGTLVLGPAGAPQTPLCGVPLGSGSAAVPHFYAAQPSRKPPSLSVPVRARSGAAAVEGCRLAEARVRGWRPAGGAHVSGGESNAASGDDSAVSGGTFSHATGFGSSVSGGNFSMAEGFYGSVSGGNDNTAKGEFSWVGGGGKNLAEGKLSAIFGGKGEKTTKEYEAKP